MLTFFFVSGLDLLSFAHSQVNFFFKLLKKFRLPLSSRGGGVMPIMANNSFFWRLPYSCLVGVCTVESNHSSSILNFKPRYYQSRLGSTATRTRSNEREEMKSDFLVPTINLPLMARPLRPYPPPPPSSLMAIGTFFLNLKIAQNGF